jgi:hypothetical protein
MQARNVSDSAFGYTFALAFAALGGYGLHAGWGRTAAIASFAAALAFGLGGAFAPRLLAPLDRGWLKLGEMLGRIVSPIVLGIIFFGILTPVAFIARRLGRDELKLKPRVVPSYWIDRTPPGPAADSFKNQF